jgi:hypothetical protein
MFDCDSTRSIEYQECSFQSDTLELMETKPMREALFLHFDEELTTGRRIPPAYTAEDIAFWLNFYALFFDRLYVPANMLTDATPETLRALQLLRMQEETSVFGETGPVKVLWDTSRFPQETFVDLYEATGRDPDYNTARDPEASLMVARLCDASCVPTLRVDMAAHLDRRESVEQLSRSVFRRAENCKLTADQAERLQECLRSIEGRYGDVGGYGRSFYYGVFGLGRTPELDRLAGRGADIVGKYRTLQDHFLTSVDYVSHSLKAFTANCALRTKEKRACRVDVLIPDEYCKYILHPEKRGYVELLAKSTQGGNVPRKHPIRRTLGRADIVALTAEDLGALHASDEYKAMAAALEGLAGASHESETDRRLAELALNAYLNRISRTLRPMAARVNELITLRACIIKVGIAAAAAIVYVSTHSDPESTIEAAKAIELFSKTLPEATDFHRPAAGPDGLPGVVRLGNEIKLYL